MRSKDWDRISEDYYKEIMSPLKDSEHNPLFAELKKIPDKFETVIDLGCGLGELTPILAKKFKKVVGIDFSKKMVGYARKKNKKYANASFFHADMRNLKKFHNSFDLAIAVNSILLPSSKDVNKTLKEIYKVLKPGGKFIAIVPAMEPYLYQSLLIIDKEIKKGKNQARAREKARKFIKKQEHDFLSGTITFEGDSQKCFYRFEIPYRFKDAGFAKLKLEKVLYSWEASAEAGQAYIPNAEPLWDWYVSCEKSGR